VLKPGIALDSALKERIAKEIRTKASARHVPNEVFEVNEIPRTLTGKKMEVPVRKLLLGMAQGKVASADSMANPASLEFFVALAAQLNANTTTKA
jgi:acetoacetyl-CoA synthetase